MSKYTIDLQEVQTFAKKLPTDQADLLLWLDSYARAQDLSPADLATKLRRSTGEAYSKDSVYQLLTGRRTAGLEPMFESIRALKSTIEDRAGLKRFPYVETSLTKKIWSLCNASRLYQRIVRVIGKSQIGKTRALEAYAQNVPNTVYVRCPHGSNYSLFVHAVAKALKLNTHQVTSDLREEIFSRFDENTILILDEMHQPFLKRGRGAAPGLILEFVREIFDECHCGIVICATDVFEEEMLTGRFSKLLVQLDRRCLTSLILPAFPSDQDLLSIAGAWGLPPAEGSALDLQEQVITSQGLGVWITTLQSADYLAGRLQQPLSWSHVERARNGLLSLSQSAA